jgi:hypothetical protein
VQEPLAPPIVTGFVVPATTVPGNVLTCELVPSVPVCVTPVILRFAVPGVVTSNVHEAGIVLSAYIENLGVVIEPPISRVPNVPVPEQVIFPSPPTVAKLHPETGLTALFPLTT